ncbi:MAG: carboxypeptidase-like regulatory domain-containing protein [Planctomycetota bacterium]|nr:carboxypeptidase-like regulatory domain-containing protein [Planctomycetota bacterium]
MSLSRRMPWLGAAMLVGLLAQAGAGEAPAPASPEDLLRVLEEGDFDARREAAAKLEELGEQAEAALAKAAEESPSLEVQEAAKRLLGLLHSATLAIELIDADGKPVAGENLTYYLAFQEQAGGQPFIRGDEQKSGATDERGRLAIEALRPGPYFLSVHPAKRQASFEVQATQFVQLESGLNRFRLRAAPTAKLTGIVRSAATGKPLKDAQVSLLTDIFGADPANVEIEDLLSSNLFGRAPSGDASTDAEGRFTLEQAAHGTYILIVKEERHRTWIAKRVTVNADRELKIPDLAPQEGLPPEARFVLQDDKGKPLASQKVMATLMRRPADPGAESYRALAARIVSYGVFESQRTPKEVATDEQGHLSLKDLKPGTYRAVFRVGDGVPLVLDEFTAAANAPAEERVLKQTPAGVLRGRMLGEDGKGQAHVQVTCLDLGDPLLAASLESVLESNPWQLMQLTQGASGKVHTSADGSYEFKNLAPGRYVLLARFNHGGMGAVFDQTVKAGETTDAPDLKGQGGGAGGKATLVKGSILRPDGKPAGGLNLTMYLGPNSTWGTNTVDNGTFQFHLGARNAKPTRLLVRENGCRPVLLDLTDGKVDLSNLQIRLEKQEYGQVRFIALDEAGTPLEGVRVGPAAKVSRHRSAQGGTAPARTTSRDGQVVLRGLATGARSFQITKPGYFIETNPSVDVKPGAEAELGVRLLKGLELKGRVRLPEGALPADALVYLHEVRDGLPKLRAREAGVDGVFRFTGLAPGTYRVMVRHPRLIAGREDGEVELKAGASPDLELDLVAPRTVEVEADPAWHAARLLAVPEGSWRGASLNRTASYMQWYQAEAVDETGRARLRALAPGKYDLLAVAQTQQHGFGGFGSTNFSRFLRALEIPPGAGDEPFRVALEGRPDGGVLTAVLALPDAELELHQGVSIELTLESGQGKALVNCQPKPLNAMGFEFVEAGRERRKNAASGGRRVDVRGLPEGRYRLRACILGMVRNPYLLTRDAEELPVLLQGKPELEVQVGAGAQVDLGTLDLTLPPETKQKLAVAQQEYYPDAQPIDEAAVLQR